MKTTIFQGQPRWRTEGRERIRFMVRHRDKFTCQGCKRKHQDGERQFDVHHLHGLCGKKSTGYDRKEDMHILITLCRECHHNRHDWHGNHNREQYLTGEAREARNQAIKKAHKAGVAPKYLAEQYGISTAMISYILHDKR